MHDLNDTMISACIVVCLTIILGLAVNSCSDDHICKGLAGGKVPFSELIVKDDKCFKYDGKDFKYIGEIE